MRQTTITSVQAGAVLMPLAMFLLSLKSIRVLSIMNFILKLAYLTEKKRLIYMHLLLLFIVLCGLPGPQERRKFILPGSVSVVQCI